MCRSYAQLEASCLALLAAWLQQLTGYLRKNRGALLTAELDELVARARALALSVARREAALLSGRPPAAADAPASGAVEEDGAASEVGEQGREEDADGGGEETVRGEDGAAEAGKSQGVDATQPGPGGGAGKGTGGGAATPREAREEVTGEGGRGGSAAAAVLLLGAALEVCLIRVHRFCELGHLFPPELTNLYRTHSMLARA